MLLAPPLAQVLEQAAQAAPGAVAGPALVSALESAGLHMDQGRQFLDVVVWTLPPGERSQDLEDRAQGDLEDLREALADVARAAGFSALPPEGGIEGTVQREALERACRALTAASARMGDALEDLRRAEEAAPAGFPLPEVDRVLRVGQRLLQAPARSGPTPSGTLASSSWSRGASQDRATAAHAAMQAFLPGAVGAVQRFSTTSPLVAELCGDADLAEALRAAGRDLEAPLGALMAYVRTGSREDLRVGCEALEALSPRTADRASELQGLVDRARGGRPAPLHLLLASMEGGADSSLLLAEMEAWLRSARTDAEVLARHPLGVLDGVDWEAVAGRASAALADLAPVASGVQARTPVSPDALAAFEEEVLALAEVWEPAARRWAARRDLLARVPALRPAAEAVGGALLGRLGPAEVDPLLGRLETLAGELTGQALQSGHAELAELLDQQCLGLQEARVALAQGRQDLLRAAWLRLEGDLPRVLEVSTELQEAARPASSGPPEYYDLAGEASDGMWTPRRLGELEALARRVASGGAGFEALGAEAARWQQRIGEARLRARDEVLPSLAGDVEKRSYAEFFLERLDGLEEGIRLLQSAADSRSLADLEAGLDLCRAAGEDLLAMRFQIGQFFR